MDYLQLAYSGGSLPLSITGAFLQNLKDQTIDEVIGANLRRLRKVEAVTLAQCAEVFSFLVGESFSEAKLSRWESGSYHFKLDDLLSLSQIYGVNLIGLLTPADDTVTHIRHGDSLYPIERYQYDFFIDPRGSFLDRATNLIERKAAGAYDVHEALDDLQSNLGRKAGLADLQASLKSFGFLERWAKQIVDGQKALQEFVDDQEAFHNFAAELKDRVAKKEGNAELEDKVAKEEGDADGINQENG
jgi:transcriptional regulator with XRE-family HTH domain